MVRRKNMELHFPHLTNGIVAPKRVKKRSKIVPMLSAASVVIGVALYFAG